MRITFDEKLRAMSELRDSRLVLAIDLIGLQGLSRSRKLAEGLKDYIVAIKFGYPTILSTGDELKKFINKFSSDFCFIADAKVADVSHVNDHVTKLLFSRGFDAIIAHGFIGYDGGLDSVARLTSEEKKGLIIVVSMSNPAAGRIMDPLVDVILEESLKTKPNGLVVPATRPEMIRRVRARVKSEMKIFSPGVGAQGAPFGSALSLGADYEIVGRAIYEDRDAIDRAKYIVEVQRDITRRLIN